MARRKIHGPLRTPMPGRSRQHKHGGGSFFSEQQRQFLWAVYPRAAKKWAHNRHTNKSDWVSVPTHSPRGLAGKAKHAAHVGVEQGAKAANTTQRRLGESQRIKSDSARKAADRAKAKALREAASAPGKGRAKPKPTAGKAKASASHRTVAGKPTVTAKRKPAPKRKPTATTTTRKKAVSTAKKRKR